MGVRNLTTKLTSASSLSGLQIREQQQPIRLYNLEHEPRVPTPTPPLRLYNIDDNNNERKPTTSLPTKNEEESSNNGWSDDELDFNFDDNNNNNNKNKDELTFKKEEKNPCMKNNTTYYTADYFLNTILDQDTIILNNECDIIPTR